MQTEELLVRYLAKLNIDQGTVEKIKEILSPDLNWAYFFDRAGSEGIISLAYKGLSEIDGAKTMVPEDVWRRLKS